MAKRVIPNSLNFTDIKPEVIENDIKLVKFIPTATVTGATGGQMIKLLISGNGFLDPYSAFFKFTVETPDLADGEVRFLDRSAHSFIQRMVIRSNGVELERIENYDIIAALINDMIYSPEQNALHAWEGFPCQEIQIPTVMPQTAPVYGQPTDVLYASLAVAQGANRINGVGSGVVAQNAPFNGTANFMASNPGRGFIQQLLGDGSSPVIKKGVGEVAFGRDIAVENKAQNGAIYSQLGHIVEFASATDTVGIANAANQPIANSNRNIDAGAAGFYTMDGPGYTDIASHRQNPGAFPLGLTTQFNAYQPVDFIGHTNGRRVPSSYNTDVAATTVTCQRSSVKTFIIPVYSGILGVLMPDKKCLPLNLLPLDIEITFNPFALYSSGTAAPTAVNEVSTTAQGSRAYQILDFSLYSNVSYYEADIHRALEVAVAEHGIFLYCNSFHYVPQTVINSTIPSSVFIQMNLKSINSVHWVFMYNNYEQLAYARRLHFVSHNLRSAQVRNGAQLIPQYAVEGASGRSVNSDVNGLNYIPFLVETLKAWNKLHDPATDGIIQAYNFCSDGYDGQFDKTFVGAGALSSNITANGALVRLINKQANVGRCQYAISLEGEEIGESKTMITGRKSEMPFLLQLSTNAGEGLLFPNATSYMIPFLRADFIVYIRPDLQIVTLGK